MPISMTYEYRKDKLLDIKKFIDETWYEDDLSDILDYIVITAPNLISDAYADVVENVDAKLTTLEKIKDIREDIESLNLRLDDEIDKIMEANDVSK